jgi:hypothetical protein
MKRNFTLIVAVVAMLVVAVVPTFAQNTRTITLTEQQINSRYRMTNPPRQQVTNKNVNLQPNQVVLSATWTARGSTPLNVSATVVPTITNGRVIWSVTTATVNGVAATAEQLTLINTHIANTWRNLISNQLPNGRITAVTITENDITFTVQAR